MSKLPAQVPRSKMPLMSDSQMEPPVLLTHTADSFADHTQLDPAFSHSPLLKERLISSPWFEFIN